MIRLDLEKRYEISALIKAGYKQNKIAEKVGTSCSTISRELKRNTGLRSYRPIQAQNKATERQLQIKRARRFTHVIQAEVERLIKKDWSPE